VQERRGGGDKPKYLSSLGKLPRKGKYNHAEEEECVLMEHRIAYAKSVPGSKVVTGFQEL
jgi:hypothetical protein